MRQRIVALAGRPEFWLGLLLAWTLLSALRSWHTPWMRIAGTEALRWSTGIGLTLALGYGLHSTGRMAQILTVGLGTLVAAIIIAGLSKRGLVAGPYGDHQLCASALLALLPFSLTLSLAAPRAAWRWGAQIVALAAAVCLALTQTRTAWAAALIGGALFAWLWLRQTAAPANGNSPRHGRQRWAIPLLLAAGVTLAFFVLVGRTEIGDPLATRAATLNTLGHSVSWQWRLHTWRGALQMIAGQPLAGWGLGHYPAAHWPFTRLEHPLAPTQRPSLSDQAHNLYLQTAVDMGLIGLGLYGAALTAFVRLALRTLAAQKRHRSRDPRSTMRDALLIAGVSLSAAQGVDALASPSWQFTEVSLLFWAGLGLSLAAVNRQQADESPGFFSQPILRRLPLYAAGIVAVTLTAQTLPVGLLSPAEAYANPAGWSLSSLVITGSTSSLSLGSNYTSGSQTVTYTMTATYQYQGNNLPPMTFTNTSDCAYASTSTSSAFLTSNNRNVLSINKRDRPTTIGASKTLTITGTLTDSNGPHSAATTLTIIAS